MRVYSESSGLVIAAAATDAARFPSSGFSRYVVHTTTEALRLIETARPRVVAIDWDVPEIDGFQVCDAARKFAHTAVLITTRSPDRAPSAIKAGCHAILLEPVVPNLIAARIGRLIREVPETAVAGDRAVVRESGTNRIWPDTRCPNCAAPSAISFEFHSHRRMWYACLACDHVWLGRRQE